MVFDEPEIAAVGLTAAQAAARGIATATAEISAADSVDRSWTYERDPRGAAGAARRPRPGHPGRRVVGRAAG